MKKQGQEAAGGAAGGADGKPPPSFEASLERLEGLVESMESGEVPLAELVSKFEEGSNLIRSCQERLREAELKIDQLRQEKGGFALEPFRPGEEI